ncbi:hypothetical protein BGV60_24380 [Burkholderia ubonensis]|uniref:hypothetical protein n=1 Tax=Burkholderia ubonensis TaxID=101571 RepID=UPI000756F8B2|nr:hypothetical protein [Burkholderia ubonensis]KWI34144.1 hypothetical protein WM04_09585 [Burkholderia ubonensis]OJB15976.1 hypothetical protein BGV53_19185 [Burkholderia ubonensis]OJB48752.1 hypothetical protein BGV59_19165 [Burkholderia ubonensis]OJB48828.1 hypothetical protein BGV60_24380 [Burkholderia ubonensis]
MTSIAQYELMYCPFCRGLAEMKAAHGLFGATCTDLACPGYQMALTFASPADAAAAWNRRAGSLHPDDVAVDIFAARMKRKLAKKRAEGRGGWNDPASCHVSTLARYLVEHVGKGDPVDVANFAMMLHQRGADNGVLPAALHVYMEPITFKEI